MAQGKRTRTDRTHDWLKREAPGQRLVMTLGKMTQDAEVTVIADGAFTAANANAQTYLDAAYIKAPAGKKITVTDDVMTMGNETILQTLAAFSALCAFSDPKTAFRGRIYPAPVLYEFLFLCEPCASKAWQSPEHSEKPLQSKAFLTH